MAPDPHSRPVVVYRWITFGLAAFYSVYMITTSSYEGPGGPFRYLTIWALLLSFFCASRVLAFSERRTRRRWDALIAATAVVNVMVVFLYWRLYFDDPASVTRNGTLNVWWREYYLHLLGPLLMWFDALVINRPFRRFWPALAVLVTIPSLYLLSAEFLVAPFNEKPVGTVTSGLPYPFLNNLELTDRLVYYALQIGAGIVLLFLFFGLSRLVRGIAGDRAD